MLLILIVKIYLILLQLQASWGYDFSWRNRKQNTTKSLGIKIPNIEYNFLNKRDSLDTLIESNPFTPLYIQPGTDYFGTSYELYT